MHFWQMSSVVLLNMFVLPYFPLPPFTLRLPGGLFINGISSVIEKNNKS